MKKITKKEVNAKKDYVVVNLYHERYSADLDICIHKNQSIIDIYNYYNFAEDFDINKLERQGYQEMGYVYDKCGSYEPSDYELTKKECKRLDKEIEEKENRIKELDDLLQDKEKRWNKVKQYIKQVYEIENIDDLDDDDYDDWED